MIAWRIAREPHAALDGEGARRYGGRWNSPGTSVIYAASHLSLTALEYLVHIHVEDVPADLVALALEVPEGAPVDVLAVESLPPDWRGPESSGCRALGDSWVWRGQALILRVPSVLIPEEENLLLNPAHPRFSEVRVTAERPFSYDPRLL